MFITISEFEIYGTSDANSFYVIHHKTHVRGGIGTYMGISKMKSKVKSDKKEETKEEISEN